MSTLKGRNFISNDTKILISNYFMELHKKNIVKKVSEISQDLSIDRNVIYEYFDLVGIEEVNLKNNLLARVILLHTQFKKNTDRDLAREALLEKMARDEEIKKQKRRLEAYKLLLQVSEKRKLESSRKQLINVLKEVSAVRK